MGHRESGKLHVKTFKDASMQLGAVKAHPLAQLATMDADGDGYISQEEWDTWFATAAGTLAKDEFDCILADMHEAAEGVVTIIKCMRLVEAPDASAVGDDLEDTEEELPQLPEVRKERVVGIFETWDTNKLGSIDRLAVMKSHMAVGPHDTKIFAQLEAMDADGDMKVTLAEMVAFFQMVSPSLSDEEFNMIADEMLEAATHACAVGDLVKLAAEVPMSGGEMEDDDDAPLVALTPAREELLRSLFDLFAQDAKFIDLVGMVDVTTKTGPMEQKLLKELSAMDADADGRLTFQEMKAYFTVVGAALADDEFQLIVGEMVDSATAMQLAKSLLQTGSE